MIKLHFKMPPTARPSAPQPKMFSRVHPASPDDDIVVTGVSGQFPNSKNVEEFAHNLYNKVLASDVINALTDNLSLKKMANSFSLNHLD